MRVLAKWSDDVSNHLAAANRRFRSPSDALLLFDGSVCAQRQLTAPVAERDRWTAKFAS